jgi:hypothetical protein
VTLHRASMWALCLAPLFRIQRRTARLSTRVGGKVGVVRGVGPPPTEAAVAEVVDGGFLLRLAAWAAPGIGVPLVGRGELRAGGGGGGAGPFLDTGEVENGEAAAARPDGLGATNLVRGHGKVCELLVQQGVRVNRRIVAWSIQRENTKQLLEIRRA